MKNETVSNGELGERYVRVMKFVETLGPEQKEIKEQFDQMAELLHRVTLVAAIAVHGIEKLQLPAPGEDVTDIQGLVKSLHTSKLTLSMNVPDVVQFIEGYQTMVVGSALAKVGVDPTDAEAVKAYVESGKAGLFVNLG